MFDVLMKIFFCIAMIAVSAFMLTITIIALGFVAAIIKEGRERK